MATKVYHNSSPVERACHRCRQDISSFDMHVHSRCDLWICTLIHSQWRSCQRFQTSSWTARLQESKKRKEKKNRCKSLQNVDRRFKLAFAWVNSFSFHTHTRQLQLQTSTGDCGVNVVQARLGSMAEHTEGWQTMGLLFGRCSMFQPFSYGHENSPYLGRDGVTKPLPHRILPHKILPKWSADENCRT